MSVVPDNANRSDETQRLRNEIAQRDAELAVIDSVQRAVGAALDFQAIADVVGDKLREVFATGDLSIRWWNADSGVMRVLYGYDHGARLPPRQLAPAPDGHLARFLQEPRTQVVGSQAAQAALGITPSPFTDPCRSLLFVPMLAGERLLGVVTLENHERDDAFGPAQVRLLETIASSMAVALENAQLFDETQRLLQETAQRNAELAVINSIQKGVAAELDFDAVIDLVGEELREVLGTGDIGIHTWSGGDALVKPRYVYEHGRGLQGEPFEIRPGSAAERILRGREVLVSGRPEDADALGFRVVPGTDRSRSVVGVPILGGDRTLGGIIVEDHERYDAFDEGRVRLLTTVAASMGVALENARLFDETQRLLKETEQRAAELAIINSVQEGLASRHRGHREHRAPDLRRRADGRADARDGRTGGDAPHRRALAGSRTAAHRGDDGQRDAGRSRDVSRDRDG